MAPLLRARSPTRTSINADFLLFKYFADKRDLRHTCNVNFTLEKGLYRRSSRVEVFINDLNAISGEEAPGVSDIHEAGRLRRRVCKSD